MTVAVVEADRVGAGVTGHTTAKLSSLHGLTYARLSSSFGDDGARVYGEANQAGIEQVAQWVEEEAIECDFRRKPNYTYASSRDDLERHREGGRGGTAGRAARLLYRGDRPALRDRRRGAVRGPGGVPSAPVPARAGGPHTGRGQPRLRADEGDWGLRRPALPREHDRGNAHRRPGGRGDALPDPRPRPLLRTHPSRAVIRAGRTRAGRGAAGHVHLRGPADALDQEPPAGRRGDPDRRRRGAQDGAGWRHAPALPGTRAVRPRALGRRERRVPVGEPGQRDGRPRPVHRKVRAPVAPHLHGDRLQEVGPGAGRRRGDDPRGPDPRPRQPVGLALRPGPHEAACGREGPREGERQRRGAVRRRPAYEARRAATPGTSRPARPTSLSSTARRWPRSATRTARCTPCRRPAPTSAAS